MPKVNLYLISTYSSSAFFNSIEYLTVIEVLGSNTQLMSALDATSYSVF